MNIWMKWWNNKEDNDNKMKWWNVIKSMIMMKWMMMNMNEIRYERMMIWMDNEW